MNKLIKQFDNLTEIPKKNLGFGNRTSSNKNKKMLIVTESTFMDLGSNHFDSFLIKDLEFDSLKKIKLSDGKSIGILNPDKNIKLKSIENADYDYVILNDLNVDSEFLTSEKLTIGFHITGTFDDDLADIIDDLPFSFVYIDLLSPPDLEKLSGIFSIANITSKISKNIFLKLNKSPSLNTLNLLSSLGINSIVINHDTADHFKLDQLVANINLIKPENSKNPRHYADLSSAMPDIDTSEDDY
jgi:hypothetical protein